MDVILTAQSLSCKYKETFIEHPHNNRLNRSPRPKHQSIAGQWQLIIKVVGVGAENLIRVALLMKLSISREIESFVV